MEGLLELWLTIPKTPTGADQSDQGGCTSGRVDHQVDQVDRDQSATSSSRFAGCVRDDLALSAEFHRTSASRRDPVCVAR